MTHEEWKFKQILKAQAISDFQNQRYFQTQNVYVHFYHVLLINCAVFVLKKLKQLKLN